MSHARRWAGWVPKRKVTTNRFILGVRSRLESNPSTGDVPTCARASDESMC
jgi:hypothetical protein